MSIGRPVAITVAGIMLVAVAGIMLLDLPGLLFGGPPTLQSPPTVPVSPKPSQIPSDSSRNPAVPTTAAPASIAPTSSEAVLRGGDGFPWSFVLPDDPSLRRLVVMGTEIWIAGDGDQIRGVFAGPFDTGDGEPTLDLAAGRLQGELAQIPGASGISDAAPLQLPAGPALRVTAQVNDLDFTGFAILHGGAAYRLVIGGYPDPIVEAVADSLAFR